MSQPILLSQRDPKWSNKKLGFSETLIKDYGCTITCIGMKFGVTPDVVNECLKAVNGFLSGNLVIWKKLEEALPGVKFVYKYGEYDNEKVKQNLPCIVEVNGAPIGGDRHWVLFIGNQKIYDPWDGQEKPTSAYCTASNPPLSFVILEGEVDMVKLKPIGAGDEKVYKGLDLTNKESMKVAIDVWERVKNGEFVEKKKHDEMLLATQEAAKKQKHGVLSQEEANLFIEELEAIMKASQSTVLWAQGKLDLLRKTGKAQGKKEGQAAFSPVEWLIKAIGFREEVK